MCYNRIKNLQNSKAELISARIYITAILCCLFAAPLAAEQCDRQDWEVDKVTVEWVTDNWLAFGKNPVEHAIVLKRIWKTPNAYKKIPPGSLFYLAHTSKPVVVLVKAENAEIFIKQVKGDSFRNVKVVENAKVDPFPNDPNFVEIHLEYSSPTGLARILNHNQVQMVTSSPYRNGGVPVSSQNGIQNYLYCLSQLRTSANAVGESTRKLEGQRNEALALKNEMESQANAAELAKPIANTRDRISALESRLKTADSFYKALQEGIQVLETHAKQEGWDLNSSPDAQ